MPTSRFTNGSEIETLNQSELYEALTHQTTTWFQEEARGFTTARFSSVSTVVNQTVQVPATDADVFGPDKGFVWTVQRLSVYGLLSGDSLSIYRNSVASLNFIGKVSSTASMLTFGSKSLVLRGGEKLILSDDSLTATGDIVVNGEAIQVSELDIYKVL